MMLYPPFKRMPRLITLLRPHTKHVRELPLLALAVWLITTFVPAGTHAEELELSGPAWILADEAYKALDRQDYNLAVSKAREAVRQRPDVARLKRLLVDALARAGRLEEAERTAGDFLRAGNNDPELSGQRTQLRQQLARRPAEAAYRALERKDYAEAARQAEAAVDYAPNVSAYRLLLISTLMAGRQLERAEAAASEAVARDGEDVVPLVMRGYIRQRLGNRAAATEDFSKALAQDWLGEDDARNLRLIVADAAIAAGDGNEAREVLKDIPSSDKDVAQRRRAALALERSKDIRNTHAQMPEPFLDCRVTPYGQECSLRPGFATAMVSDAASEGYRAFAQRDYATAARSAREALEIDPANAGYNTLLVSALSAAGNPTEAERAATAALKRVGPNRELYAQRAYARLQLNQPAAAAADFSTALKTPGPNDRLLRLGLADAALAAKQPQLALDALSHVRERSYAIASRRAFALLALNQKDEALTAIQEGRALAASAAERSLMLRTEVGLLADVGRGAEAAALFAKARADHELVGSDLDLAYLATQVKDDETADEYFSRAEKYGRLRGLALVDAAYAAKRLMKNERAKALLRTAIDAAVDGRIVLQPQALFGLRREMAELERTWGFYSSLSYGAVGVMPSAPFTAPLSGGNVLQAGTEVYWRPPLIGYRNGSTFEVFTRAFQTLHDETSATTGMSTTQGSFGARWKPFGDANLVLEVSRLFPIGKYSRSDTLLRAAYSTGDGTDLRVDVPEWWMWQAYAEAGHYVENRQTIATAEARVGRSYRLDGISNRLVLTPFVAVGISYDNKLATPEAFGVGPGLNLRYWFREDKYTAPMSYVDINVQYRFRLAGDDRAEGVFAGITVAY